MSNVIPFPTPRRASVHPVDEALSWLRIAELRTGICALEATDRDLERLNEALMDVLAEYNGGVR